jgi:hypothetical protein
MSIVSPYFGELIDHADAFHVGRNAFGAKPLMRVRYA